MKSFAKYSLLTALVILLTCGLLFAFLVSAPGEEVLAKLATDFFNERFDHNIEIGTLETNFLSRLVIQDVSLSVKGEPPGDFASIQYLEVNYQLSDFFHKRITVHSVMLDGVSLLLSSDSTGQLILPRPKIPKPQKQPRANKASSVKTTIEEVSLRHGQISYLGGKSDISGLADQVSIQANQLHSTTTFSVDVQSIQFSGYGIEDDLSSFHLNGVNREDRVELNELRFSSSMLAYDGRGEVDFSDVEFPFHADLTISGDVGELASKYNKFIPARLRPVAGNVAIHLTAEGTKSNPMVRLRTELPRLSLGNIDVSHCLLSAQASRDSIIVDKLALSLIDGNVEGEGYLCLDSLMTHRFGLRYHDFSLRKLYQILLNDSSIYSGTIDGNLVASGKLKNINTMANNFNFSVRNMEFAGRKIPSLSVSAHVKNSRADIKVLQDQNLINASVGFADSLLNGSFNIDIPDVETLAGLANLENLTGAIQVKGNISGSQQRPDVSGKFTGEGIEYLKLPLDEIYGGFSYKNGKLTLGDISFHGAMEDLSEIKLLQNASSIHGSLTYQGVIDGKLDGLTGRVSCALARPSYGEYQFDSADAEISVNDNRVTLESLTLSHQHYSLFANGRMLLDTRSGIVDFILYENHLKDEAISDAKSDNVTAGKVSANFNLSNRNNINVNLNGDEIALSVVQQIVGLEQHLAGQLELDLSLRGNITQPSGAIRIVVDNGQYGEYEADNLSGIFSLNGEKFAVDTLIITHNENKARLSGDCLLQNDDGKLSFTSDSPINFILRADSLDASLFAEFLPKSKVTGRINSRINFKGSVKRPHLFGDLDWMNGGVVLSDSRVVVEDAHCAITMRDTVFILRELKGSINGQYLALQGKATSKDFKQFISDFSLSDQRRKLLVGSGVISADQIDYDIAANDLDLSMFQSFAPQLASLQGTMNASLIVQGKTREPEFNGKLNFTGLSYQPAALTSPFTDGLVAISFNGYKVTLDSAKINYNDGYISATGAGEWGSGGFTAFQIHTQARQLDFAQAKEYKINLKSADIDYKLVDNSYKLDGEVILGESRILHRFQPDAFLKFLQKTEKPAAEMPDILRRTQFNIRLKESEDIWIDNNLAKLRLHSELAVTGSPAKPNLNGRLSVREGYFYYLDRKFNVDTGILDFVDPNKLNPQIDLVAQTSVRNYKASAVESYQVNLSINGELDKPQISLTSDPALDRPDIMLLLTLGITRDNSNADSKSGKGVIFTDVIKDRLEETSSRRISGYLSKKAESTLGLTQFTVEGNLFNVNKESGPQLISSRKLTKKMELTYYTTVGHINEQGIRLDYTLNKHFSLEGQTDQKGESGIDLKFRIKF